MRTSIVLMGCSQPSRLAPERAPVIETAGYICVQYKLGLDSDRSKDGFNGIMDRASWAEPVRVGFETGFPFGLEGQPDERLCGSRAERRNAKRPLLGFAGFRNPHPTHRL